MNLVFIYGPPASGKLTISEELVKTTGYKLFHNHITRDLVRDLYPDDLADKYELVNNLRLEVFEFAARHNTNMIFTWVYDGVADDEFVKSAIAKVTLHNGRVLFVETKAKNETLLERVGNDSRKLYFKLSDVNIMQDILNTHKFESIPHVKPLIIDTSNLEPVEAAKIIVDHYQL